MLQSKDLFSGSQTCGHIELLGGIERAGACVLPAKWGVIQLVWGVGLGFEIFKRSQKILMR